MARKKEIDRDRILDAADAVILESGGRKFTLDAVAVRAGISKGGLVYSFATKDELIAAALDREMARFQTALRKRLGDGSPGAVERLLANLEEMLAEEDQLTRKAALLTTAFVHASDMAESARQLYRNLFEHFDPSTPEGRDVRQAMLAVEGLFLLRGLDLIDDSPAQWRCVIEHARDTISRILEKNI